MSIANRETSSYRGSRLSLLAWIAADIIVAAVLMVATLWLLDVPSGESYPAEHVKRLRFIDRTHVFRSEGYSRYRVNSLGFLGDEPESISDRSVFRIAVFGDSLVEALQVWQAEKFTSILERTLPVPVGYRKVEVWNLGFSGDNTGNAFARWRYLVHDVPFDLVLFSFNDGDLLENRPGDPNASIGAFLIPDGHGGYTLDESRMEKPNSRFGNYVRERFGRPLYSFYLVRLRVNDYLQRKRTEWAQKRARTVAWFGDAASGPTRAATSLGSTVDASTVADTVAQLTFVQRQIAKKAGSVFILGVPSSMAFDLPRAPSDVARRKAYQEVVRNLVTTGVPTIDPYPAVDQEIARGRDPFRAWESGGHYNAAGHVIVAKEILKALAPRLGVQSNTVPQHAVQ